MADFFLKDLKQKLLAARYSVAILSPIGEGSHREVIHGFTRSNERAESPMRVYQFFSRGPGYMNVRICLEEILQDNYDLLITVGWACSMIAKEITGKRSSKMPLLFVGVSNALETGLIDSVDGTKENMTGVTYSKAESNRVISFLHTCKTRLKSLLLPCESPDEIVVVKDKKQIGTYWLAAESQIVADYCHANNINCLIQNLPSALFRYQHIKKELVKHDALMILEGSLSQDIITSLGDFCSEKNITLCSGQLASVRDGIAAVGYGMNFTEMGQKAFEYAQKIVFEKIYPGNLPCYLIPNVRIPAVNLESAKQQGLDPNYIEAVCKECGGNIYR